MVDIEIRSNVVWPRRPDDPYVAVASACPAGVAEAPGDPCRSVTATSLQEARWKSCELALSIKRVVQESGCEVRALKCSQCPTSHSPLCGKTN